MAVAKYIIALAFRRQRAPHLLGLVAPQHSENVQTDEPSSQLHAVQQPTQRGFGGGNPSLMPLPLHCSPNPKFLLWPAEEVGEWLPSAALLLCAGWFCVS